MRERSVKVGLVQPSGGDHGGQGRKGVALARAKGRPRVLDAAVAHLALDILRHGKDGRVFGAGPHQKRALGLVQVLDVALQPLHGLLACHDAVVPHLAQVRAGAVARDKFCVPGNNVGKVVLVRRLQVLNGRKQLAVLRLDLQAWREPLDSQPRPFADDEGDVLPRARRGQTRLVHEGVLRRVRRHAHAVHAHASQDGAGIAAAKALKLLQTNVQRDQRARATGAVAAMDENRVRPRGLRGACHGRLKGVHRPCARGKLRRVGGGRGAL